jgi:antitoxin (DNA-binding transcriptional repressor) of toxin-antitoxin stability system
MATRITATQLARNLSDILNRARYRGETFVIERNGETMARLEPAAVPAGVPFAEFVRLIGELHWPDDTFASDLEAIHAAQGEIGPPLSGRTD